MYLPLKNLVFSDSERDAMEDSWRESCPHAGRRLAHLAVSARNAGGLAPLGLSAHLSPSSSVPGTLSLRN